MNSGKILSVFLMLTIGSKACAQITFQHAYKIHNYYTVISDAVQTTDSGCLFIATIDSGSVLSTQRAVLSKCDKFGNLQWSNMITDTVLPGFSGSGRYIARLHDGNYLISFMINQASGFIKVNDAGNVLASYLLPSVSVNIARIIENSNHDLIIAINGQGHSYSLVKTDSLFNVVWVKKYLPADTLLVSGIVMLEAADEGFYYSVSINDLTNEKYYTAKSDYTGNELWRRWFNGAGNAIFPQPDSGCVQFIESAVSVERMNKNGGTVWSKTYSTVVPPPGSYLLRIGSASRTFDGGYAVSVDGYSFSTGDEFFSALRLDSMGNPLWMKKYAKGYPFSIRETSDSGLLISGFNEFSSLIVKTDSAGSSNCSDTIYSVSFTSPSLAGPATTIVSTTDSFTFMPYNFIFTPGYTDSSLCLTATGITLNPDVTEDLFVFPNPAKELLNIRSSDFFSAYALSLYDMQGRRVLQKNFISSTSVGLSEISPGIYVYEVFGRNGQERHGKLVRQ